MFIQATAGTPSSFSSFGLTPDLSIKPQLTGIGGMVYSTISVSSAVQNKLTGPYVIMSGTSMATPYVAGYVFTYFLKKSIMVMSKIIEGYTKEKKEIFLLQRLC
jgi:hypothetical protein